MGRIIRRHLYDCRYIYAAFLISAAIYILVFAGRQLWPFGTRSILKVDLFHQYAPYLAEFRSRLLSGKSLIYSWQTGLGKDFLAQSAYYAASPLNLIFFLFPPELISEGIAVLILVKASLSSASFTWYLREHFKRNDLSILIFGLLYGFCAFITCYYWNTMWLDTVALFPLVALGCEKLVRDNQPVLYYISLALTMIVNFYLSVLVCVLITIYALIIAFTNPAFDGPDGRKALVRATGRFILVSFLCAMTAAIILVPVAAALGETAVSGERAFPAFRIYPNIWQLVNAHFLGARDAVLARNEDMPNVYTGVLTILVLPLYYCSRDVSRREKALYSAFLVFMLLCAVICPLDYMIHGFHFPANLPHRYTFVYSFILLSMAYRGFISWVLPDINGVLKNPDINAALKDKKTVLPENKAALPEKRPDADKQTEKSSAIPAREETENSSGIRADGAVTPVQYTTDEQADKKIGGKTETGTAERKEGKTGHARGHKKNRRLLRALAAVYCTAAFCVVAILCYEYLIAQAEADIDHVLSGTDIILNMVLIAFYLVLLLQVLLLGKRKGRAFQKKQVTRIVLPFLLVCVIGECIFSLYQNMYDRGDRGEYIYWMKDTKDAVAYMEDRQDGAFFRTDFDRFVTINEGSIYDFNGFSHFSSLAPGGISMLMEHLGVAAAGNSYRFYDTSPLIDAIFDVRYVLNRYGGFSAADLGCKLVPDQTFGTVRVGVNNRVLAPAFMTDRSVLDWKTTDSQPFEVQNDFVRRAAGIDEDLFTIQKPALIQATNMEVYNVNEVGDVFDYYLADPYNLDLVPSVHAEFVSDRDQYLCFYVDAPNAARFIYSSHTTSEDRELSAGRSMINVGFVQAGETVLADFVLTRRGIFDMCYPGGGSVKLFAAGWNDDVFEKAFARLDREPLEITSFKDTQIRGSVDASEDGILLTSIPYTAGWKAKVDGKSVRTEAVGDGGLVGVPMSSGHHEILLQYRSPFLIPALISTLLGPVLFVLYLRLHRTGRLP